MKVSDSDASRGWVQFFWQAKWWWLTPAIVVLVTFTALILFAEDSPVAPFIYTLF